MTPDDLSEILDAATPGPWHHGPESHNVRTASSYCSSGFRISCESGIGDHSEDVALIVALRNLAPALLRLWRAAKSLRSLEETTSPSIRAAKEHYLDEALRELCKETP